MANNGFMAFCENVWLIQSLEGHIVHLPVRKKYFPSGVFISKVPFLETLVYCFFEWPDPRISGAGPY